MKKNFQFLKKTSKKFNCFANLKHKSINNIPIIMLFSLFIWKAAKSCPKINTYDLHNLKRLGRAQYLFHCFSSRLSVISYLKLNNLLFANDLGKYLSIRNFFFKWSFACVPENKKSIINYYKKSLIWDHNKFSNEFQWMF